MSAPHHRKVEFRVSPDGRTASGVVVKYGDCAVLADGTRERFSPGAFDGDLPELKLNIEHTTDICSGPVAILRDVDALRFRATLDAGIAELVKRGAVTGASAEFFPVEERRDQGERIIERAALVGIALTADPAYHQSRVEVRHAARRRNRTPWM